MDSRTCTAYDKDAAVFAQDWLAQPVPEDLYALLQRYFSPGATADIGCGAGRDTAWLCANGFTASGYDASAGLLEQARRRYPAISFTQAALPALEMVPNDYFQNVLCETVIMHLQPSELPAAVRRLLDVLRVGGVLYLSWRVTTGESQRDKHDRLYAAFDADVVLKVLDGQEILFNREETSLSSGKTIARMILRKTR